LTKYKFQFYWNNFVLKDKQLSFSLKEPFNFISKNNYSVKKIPFSYFQTAKNSFPDFNFLFQNNSLCRSWRCLSNYVRTFAKNNYTNLKA